MAEAIKIPSPSVFLRRSPTPPISRPQTAKPAAKNARRPSPAEEKKKAQRKDSGPVNGADGSVAKPKQSKSRNGCMTCKAKRLKCGEEKPGCQQCARRHVECGGYKKDFKWRPFEETNVKVNIDRQKRGNSPNHASAPTSLSTTPKPKGSSKRDNSGDWNGELPDEKKDSPVEDRAFPLRTRPVQKPAPSKGKRGEARYDQKQPSPTQELPDPVQEISPEEITRLLPEETPSTSGPTSSISADDLYPGALSHLTPGLGLPPDLTDILWPFHTDDQFHQDFVSFDLSEAFQNPFMDDPEMDPTFADEDGENVVDGENITNDELEDIVGNNGIMDDLAFLTEGGQLTPPLSDTPASPDQDPRESLGYLYPQPFFGEDSVEMLSFRFDKLTCGILSVVDGPTENPWRSLIWPLAQQSPALYHAITAMTAFHSASDVPQLREVGLQHKAASMKYTREGIRDQSFSKQTAIAAALALGYAESWEQHTVTGNLHIKGAQAMVKEVIKEHKQHPVHGVELARLKFLCNAWVYMDVIARLTSVDSDESQDFDNTFLFSNDPNNGPALIMGDVAPGFGIDFGLPVDTRLDPLMGCANTLFPLIGRVANLVRKICRTTFNSPSVITQASKLKLALEEWDPPNFIESPEDPTTDVEHTLQTAEAYRWATLLHLHSAVPELPSLSSAELAQRVLQYLATVPLASRTVIVQIYPLMVAGCEAKTDEDRQWVRNRWAAMNGRMRIGVIGKCDTVTEEVWRRRDAYEAQPPSHRKLVATAELHPNKRRNSQPLVRSPTGNLRLGDPGSTGMVFTFLEGEEGRGLEDPDNQHKITRGRERGAGRDPRQSLEIPYTVRGHLHWVGVMWDWGWEILLG